MAALLVGLLAPAAPGVAAPLSTTAAGRVSAEGDVVAWSEPFRTGSGKRRYRLVASTGQEPARTVRGLRSRSVPFDVDLGRDAHGAVVALYSRCRREADFSREESGQPSWDFGAGCSVYQLDVAGGRERRLRSVDGRGEPFLPSRSGPRVAFGRRVGPRVGLQVLDLRTGRQRSLRGGTGANVRSSEFPDFPELINPGPLSVDLRGREVLFSWSFLPRGGCPLDAGLKTQTVATEIWVQRAGSRGDRVAEGCSSGDELTEVAAPAWVGKSIAYRARTGLPSEVRDELRCVDASGTRMLGSVPFIRSLAAAGDQLVAYIDDNLGHRSVERLAVSC